MSENSQPRSVSCFPRFVFNLKQGFITILSVERGFSDAWSFNLYIPMVKFGKNTESEWFSDEIHHNWLFRFQTEVEFDKSPYSWYITGKLLGFGASLSHQYGY